MIEKNDFEKVEFLEFFGLKKKQNFDTYTTLRKIRGRKKTRGKKTFAHDLGNWFLDNGKLAKNVLNYISYRWTTNLKIISNNYVTWMNINIVSFRYIETIVKEENQFRNCWVHWLIACLILCMSVPWMCCVYCVCVEYEVCVVCVSVWVCVSWV